MTAAPGRILDAVLTLLSQQGIGGVSMRAVAREAGVALGLVNYHYADKTTLICAALRRIEEQDIAPLSPDPTLAPVDRLLVALRRVADPEFLTTPYLSLRLQLWALAQAGAGCTTLTGCCWRPTATRRRAGPGDAWPGPSSRR